MITTLAQPLSQQSLLEISALLFLQNLEVDFKLKQQWASLQADIKSKLALNSTDSYQQVQTVLDNFLVSRGYPTNVSTVLAFSKKLEYQDYLGNSQPNAESDRFVQDLFHNVNLEIGWTTAISLVISNKLSGAIDAFLKQYQYHCNAYQIRASMLKARQQNLLYWTGIYNAGLLTFEEDNQFYSEPAPVLIVYGEDKVAWGVEKLDWQLNQMKYDQGILEWTADEFGTTPHSGKITFNQVAIGTEDDPYVGNEYFGIITFSQDHPNYAGKTATIIGRVEALTTVEPATRSLTDPPGNNSSQTPPTIGTQILHWLAGRIGFPVSCTVGGLLIVLILGGTLWKYYQFTTEFPDKAIFTRIKKWFSDTQANAQDPCSTERYEGLDETWVKDGKVTSQDIPDLRVKAMSLKMELQQYQIEGVEAPAAQEQYETYIKVLKKLGATEEELEGLMDSIQAVDYSQLKRYEITGYPKVEIGKLETMFLENAKTIDKTTGNSGITADDYTDKDKDPEIEYSNSDPTEAQETVNDLLGVNQAIT